MSYNEAIEEPRLFLDALIDDFGCFRECPASIKHAKTGQYIICNGNLANRDGIPIENYIGLTAYDIGKIMNRKKAVTENAVAVDQKLATQNLPFVCYNQVIIGHDKSVIIEEVFKKSVFSRDNQVAAILAYAHDITRHAHPLYLFNLYASYHPPKEAIQRFLAYKKIDTVFEVLPTYEELLTLITLRDFPDTALAANKLGYSVAEVERYQAQLKDKLPIIGLHEVIALLEWHSEESGRDAIG